MSAVRAFRRAQIKLNGFRSVRTVKKLNNFFGKKRSDYLSAVVEKNEKVLRETETKIIAKLNVSRPELVSSAVLRETLVRCLRKGFFLGNIIQILEINRELSSVSLHNPKNPAYRKKEVLEKELQLTEIIYESLRESRKKALQAGLLSLAKELEKEISAKAKSIAQYKKIFDSRLVE